MTIQSGQNLLHYRVTEKLGEGGMGVVWKAVDTTLDREVAVKILPDAFAQDVERLARFEREAKLLASLNHPNIAAIYGFHEAEAQRFLAMELIPGEELAARVKRESLSVEQALQICRQIASALDAAHESGVIHRDLKPANIKLMPGDKVKVLDFGLAKAFETSPGDTSLSQSPTMTSAGTQAGMILGTAAYMSPEQARGQVVDKRTDVWAFGCVLYECLTGRQAFGGDTVSDVLASILKTEPDWSALSGRCSARTVRLLRRCLEKDPGQRLRDIGDAGIEIDELLAGDPTVSEDEDAGHPASWLRVAVAGVAGVLIGALLWSVLGSRDMSSPDAQGPLRLDIAFTEPRSVELQAVSQDGRAILMRDRQGYSLRRTDGFDTRPIPDTELCQGGVFSPDGRSIALFCFSDSMIGRGKLLRVSLDGGPRITLYESASDAQPFGWSGDTIWIGYGEYRKLGGIPATGGEPVDVVDLSEEQEFLRPMQVLPGGHDALVHVSGGVSDDRTELISLDSGDRRVVAQDDLWDGYAATGHLLRNRNGHLMALPYDIKSLRATGPAVPVLSDVARQTVSTSGTLFYLPAVGADSAGFGQLTISDRAGKMKSVSEKVRGAFARYSPDGRMVSIVNGDVTLYDLADGTVRPLEFGDLEASDHEWMPDGNAVAYAGFGPEPEKCAIYRHAIDGRTPPAVLHECDNDGPTWPTGWSPDGSAMIFSRYADEDSDLWLLPADGSEPVPLMVADDQNDDLGRFSPDGRWIAYESDESGQQEIYVRAYLPDSRSVGPKWRISNGGGTDAQWSPDGNELYYESLVDMKLIAVPIRRSADGSNALAIGEPTELFDFGALGVYVSADQSYDVAPDGKSFVFIRHESTKYSGIRVVLNWFEELERLAPADR